MSKKRNKDSLKKIERQTYNENDEIMRMIKVFAGVVLALLAFYFIFAIYNGEIKFGKDKTSVPVEIQNVEILAGSTFNRIEDEYYVLMYDFDGDYATKGITIYNLCKEKNNVKMYLVDLGNVLNAKHLVTERSSVNVDTAETLKVMEPTLLKIKSGKAEIVKAGVEEIDSYQETLFK
jgi:hypothetical protein